MKTITLILLASFLAGCATTGQPANARLSQSWQSVVSIPLGRDIPESFIYAQLTSILKEHDFQLHPDNDTWTPADLEAITRTNNPAIPVSLVIAAISMQGGSASPMVCRFQKDGLKGLIVTQRHSDTDSLSIEATADDPGTVVWSELDQIVNQIEKLRERAYRSF